MRLVRNDAVASRVAGALRKARQADLEQRKRRVLPLVAAAMLAELREDLACFEFVLAAFEFRGMAGSQHYRAVKARRDALGLMIEQARAVE